MSYIGKKPPFITIPDDDSVTSAMIVDGTITSTDMAVDPRNASNLNSGDVPLAQLDNVDTSGIVSNKDDIALLGFKVAANGSLARYNLVDQSIDAFEDASGIDASASTDEVRNVSNYYSGVVAAPTGGTIATHGSYTSHKFTTGGNFIPSIAGNVSVLLVGGGGAGGSDNPGGGGGASSVEVDASHAVTATTYAITIGSGGTVRGGTGSDGGNGVNSTFSSLTAYGGGGGDGTSSASSGGSGGGGNSAPRAGASAGTGSNVYAGGSGSASPYSGGGGGGATAVGLNGNTGGGAGDGGDGMANDYETGSNQYYGGGGGGGGYSPSSMGAGEGGSGGGGDGSAGSGSSVGQAGTANTGGGGGGGSNNASPQDGGAGGSGVAVIRYTTADFVAYNDMTLVSNAQTAQSAPTTGDLVITYTDGAGTAIVNTDIKAYISRNGSAYTSAVTLASQGTTGGHTILTANGVDLSGITTGTSMRWKIETLNQSISKETRIQAVSLGWS